ncbi:hypothetical protein MCEMIEM12_01772 [Burkholderiaceae bacterium]
MIPKFHAISLATLLVLVGCGGGGGTSSTSSVSATDAYPTGLAVASPTAVVSSSSPVVAKLDLPFKQRVGDWWEHLLDAVNKGDAHQLAQVLNPFIPIATANAAPAKVLESQNVSNYIQKVVRGESTPDATILPLNGFFKSYTSATCYGPKVAYLQHNDGTDVTPPGATGPELPGGDVGMWLDRNGDQTTGTPCAAAQLNALMDPIKSRANASLMLGARMVALAAASGSGLPAPNTSSSLTASFQTFINGILPSGTTADVTLAGVTNNGSDSFTYQWRVKFTKAPKEMWLLVNLTHQKTTSGYTGLLQYATSELSANTQATAQCATSKKLAVVGTMRYNKSSSTQLDFSAREAPYCVTADTDLVTDFGSWVSLDSNKELDTTKTTSTDSKGWHQEGGGFKRFAASFNPDTGAGNYLFAWQAGIGDPNSRMFAVNSDYNSSSEARTLKAFFGFAPNMAATSNQSQLGELICNWAGPGNDKTVGHKKFQSQLLSLTSTATDWSFPTNVATDSKIRFAPTNNCNSTGAMNFDVDASGILEANEGANVTNSLDVLTGTNASVFDEIKSRGFSAPSMY